MISLNKKKKTASVRASLSSSGKVSQESLKMVTTGQSTLGNESMCSVKEGAASTNQQTPSFLPSPQVAVSEHCSDGRVTPGTRVADHADVLRIIMQHLSTDKPTLVACMRTTTTFYHSASPVLYETLVVKGHSPIRIFTGVELRQRSERKTSTVDRRKKKPKLKMELLQQARTLELGSHRDCHRVTIQKGLEHLNIATLRLQLFGIPYWTSRDRLCSHREECYVLDSVRPLKIVFPHSPWCHQGWNLPNSNQRLQIARCIARVKTTTLVLDLQDFEWKHAWELFAAQQFLGNVEHLRILIIWRAPSALLDNQSVRLPSYSSLTGDEVSLPSDRPPDTADQDALILWNASAERALYNLQEALPLLVQSLAAKIDIYLLTTNLSLPEHDMRTSTPDRMPFHIRKRDFVENVKADIEPNNRKISISNLPAYLDESIRDELDDLDILRLEIELDEKRMSSVVDATKKAPRTAD